MYEKMRGVVLRVVKYSDSNSIAHIYTDVRGRLAFLVPQGKTRGARERRAMLMPLSLLEFEARVAPGRDLATMRGASQLVPLAGLRGDPVKSAVAMFVSELLWRAIQESERNAGLWEYILRSVMFLDAMRRGVANFHICFMCNLGPFLGIQPDVGSYREGYWFDMENGVFVSSRPRGACLEPGQASALALISRMTFSNLHLFRFSQGERNAVVDAALRYFQLHNATVGGMRSPDVLRQLFV